MQENYSPAQVELSKSGNGLSARNCVSHHDADSCRPEDEPATTNGSEVTGVWLLRSYYLENQQTGERIEPYGSNPKGVFMMHPEGRIAVVMTPGEQGKAVTEADQAQAFRKLIAYSGLYRVEPPDRLVTAVDIAWFEPWVGSEQVRKFSVEEDMLKIVSAPTRTPLTGDALVVGVLSWTRDVLVER
jgi:hypothetical protein